MNASCGVQSVSEIVLVLSMQIANVYFVAIRKQLLDGMRGGKNVLIYCSSKPHASLFEQRTNSPDAQMCLLENYIPVSSVPLPSTTYPCRARTILNPHYVQKFSLRGFCAYRCSPHFRLSVHVGVLYPHYNDFAIFTLAVASFSRGRKSLPHVLVLFCVSNTLHFTTAWR